MCFSGRSGSPLAAQSVRFWWCVSDDSQLQLRIPGHVRNWATGDASVSLSRPALICTVYLPKLGADTIRYPNRRIVVFLVQTTSSRRGSCGTPIWDKPTWNALRELRNIRRALSSRAIKARALPGTAWPMGKHEEWRNTLMYYIMYSYVIYK